MAPLYHPSTVTVLGLRSHVTRQDVEAHFSEFGPVARVAIRARSTHAYAFVEFARAACVEAVMETRHTVCGAPVRVLRAYTVRLPDRPFPGMAPPVAPPRKSAWEEDRSMWEAPLFYSIASLWP